MNLSRESAEAFLHDTIPGSSETNFSNFSPEFGIKVVRMTIAKSCPASLATTIRKGLLAMKYCDLDYDLVDKGPDDTSDITGTPATTVSKMVGAIDLLQYVLNKQGHKLKDMYVLQENI